MNFKTMHLIYLLCLCSIVMVPAVWGFDPIPDMIPLSCLKTVRQIERFLIPSLFPSYLLSKGNCVRGSCGLFVCLTLGILSQKVMNGLQI